MKDFVSVFILSAVLGACSWEAKDLGGARVVEVNVNPENPKWKADGRFAGIQDLVATKCDDCHGDLAREGIPGTTTMQLFGQMDNLMFLSYSKEIFERVFGEKSQDPHTVMPLPYGNPLSGKEKVALCRFMKQGQGDIKEVLTKSSFGESSGKTLFAWISNNRPNFNLANASKENYEALKEDYHKQVKPVLMSLCSNCHTKNAPAKKYPISTEFDFSTFEAANALLNGEVKPNFINYFKPEIANNFAMPLPIDAKYLNEGEHFVDCSQFDAVQAL